MSRATKLWIWGIAAVLMLGGGVVGWLVWSNNSREVRETYIACGCGGCGDLEPEVVEVKSKDEFDRLIAQDKEVKSSAICAAAGCSICTEYRLVG